MDKIRVILRNSPLSQLQVKEVFNLFPEVEKELMLTESYGDKHLQISLLNGQAPADIFTRELDDALLTDMADIAVHSAKDLPFPMPDGLEVIALFQAWDVTDSLVSRNGLKLDELPAGSTIGTSSPIRKAELQQLRSDLTIVGIRGTIAQRVQQVRQGQIDAVIVATCALKRLNIANEISEVLPFATHPLQGYLAITARADSDRLRHLFARKSIMDEEGMLTIRDEEGNLRKMTLEKFAHTQPHHHPVTIDPTEPGRTLYTGITCSNSNYVHTPLIEIAPMADDSELEQSALHINQYDCLLFTSRYAVKYWMEALHKSGQDTSVLSSLQVVSIGATTTESLRQAGVSNVEESKADNSYSLINHFKDLPHQRILIPRSNLGMDLLPGGLRSVGHEVTTVTAYRNVMPEYPQKVDLNQIYRIIFTSPSTITNFIKLYGTMPATMQVETRGPITREAFVKAFRTSDTDK